MLPDRIAFEDDPNDPRASDEGERRPNGAARQRFKPVRFKDIKLATDRPYLVKGLIPREGLVLIWGPPKCGKSFWTFDLVLHVALGWNYRGRRVQQGTVVYVACEGERGLGARTEAFRSTKLSEDADPPFFLLTTRLDLVADANQLITDIQQEIGANDCAAIVIDTLNRSIAGSESRDEDMGAFVKAADRLREAFHAAVIIIHHCGIASDRPRGHTSLLGAADAEIAVKRDDAERIIATVKSMKDGPEGDIISSKLAVVALGLDDDGEAITSCVVENAEGSLPADRNPLVSPAQKRALELLADALATSGEIPVASNHIPSNMPCVTEEVWREYCYRGAISEGSQDAKQKAFKRAAQALLAAHRIGKWDNLVWLVKAGQTGQ